MDAGRFQRSRRPLVKRIGPGFASGAPSRLASNSVVASSSDMKRLQ
jgi:hypothetical protein